MRRPKARRLRCVPGVDRSPTDRPAGLLASWSNGPGHRAGTVLTSASSMPSPVPRDEVPDGTQRSPRPSDVRTISAARIDLHRNPAPMEVLVSEETHPVVGAQHHVPDRERAPSLASSVQLELSLLTGGETQGVVAVSETTPDGTAASTSSPHRQGGHFGRPRVSRAAPPRRASSGSPSIGSPACGSARRRYRPRGRYFNGPTRAASSGRPRKSAPMRPTAAADV